MTDHVKRVLLNRLANVLVIVRHPVNILRDVLETVPHAVLVYQVVSLDRAHEATGWDETPVVLGVRRRVERESVTCLLDARVVHQGIDDLHDGSPVKLIGGSLVHGHPEVTDLPVLVCPWLQPLTDDLSTDRVTHGYLVGNSPGCHSDPHSLV